MPGKISATPFDGSMKTTLFTIKNLEDKTWNI
jgi:hypothetical protein